MLLRAYALGIFPMAERRDDDEVYWVDPERRGILPLDKFHLPRRLARTIRQERFEVVFGDQPAASRLYRPELAGRARHAGCCRPSSRTSR